MAQNFREDLVKALWIETAMQAALQSAGHASQKMDYRIFPYDLTALIHDKRKTFEVKALDWQQNGYWQAVAEIWKNDSKTQRPQWIQHNDEIDIMCIVNMATYEAHFFDATKLRDRFLERELQGDFMNIAHAGAGHRGDSPGYIFKFEYGCKEHGAMTSPINLLPALYEAGNRINVDLDKQSKSVRAIWKKVKEAQLNALPPSEE